MTVQLSAMRSLIAKLEAQKRGETLVFAPPAPPLKIQRGAEKIAQNQSCPTCPTRPTEKTVTDKGKRDKTRTEPEGVITEWRAAIARIKPTLPEIDKLKTASLRFLDAHEAVAAVENGWDAVALFGVHEGNAPKERVGGWGIVIFLAWGVHKCTVDAIEPDVCRLRTRSGAVQSQQRRKADHDHAVPWWRHPGVTGEMEGADHD